MTDYVGEMNTSTWKIGGEITDIEVLDIVRQIGSVIIAKVKLTVEVDHPALHSIDEVAQN